MIRLSYGSFFLPVRDTSRHQHVELHLPVTFLLASGAAGVLARRMAAPHIWTTVPLKFRQWITAQAARTARGRWLADLEATINREDHSWPNRNRQCPRPRRCLCRDGGGSLAHNLCDS